MLSTVAAVGVYVIAQQVGRHAADDVPRAVAARAVQQLADGATPTQVTGAAGVELELASSAVPFVVVFDANHDLLASSASVNGKAPAVPAGVLDRAMAAGVDVVTWQPASGVREAVVATPWEKGTAHGVLVAGAGLGPTEERAGGVRTATLLAWAASLLLLASLYAVVISRRPVPRRLASGRDADQES